MGVTSNEVGKFQLKVPEKFWKDSLVISHIGFADLKIALADLSGAQKFYLSRQSLAMEDLTIVSPNGPEKMAKYRTIKAVRQQNDTLFSKITLDSAFQLAQRTGQEILLYFTARWCGPCNRMDMYVYPDSTVANTLKYKYLSLKVDIDSEYGKKLASRYQVAAYPTFIVLNGQGKTLKRRASGMLKQELLDFLDGQVMDLEDGLTAGDRTAQLFNRELRGKFRPGPGVAVGLLPGGGNIGFSSRVLVQMEKFDWMIRPGIEYLSRYTGNTRINELVLPVDLGNTFKRVTVGGTRVGIRYLLTPYFGLVKVDGGALNTNTYGLRTGVEFFIGDTSNLALTAVYNHGMKGGFNVEKQEVLNRGLQLGFLLAF